jgi:uncharacterized protein
MPQYVYESIIPHAPERVFEWYLQPGTFDRLVPPWESVTVLSQSNGLGAGLADQALVTMQVGLDPLGVIQTPWVAQIKAIQRPGDNPDPKLIGFEDVQLDGQGPFAKWHHKHRFLPGPQPNTCLLREDIRYSLWFWWLGPAGLLANTFGSVMVTQKLNKLFKYRHAVTLADLNQLYPN